MTRIGREPDHPDTPFLDSNGSIHPSKPTCDEGFQTFRDLYERWPIRFVISTIVRDAFRAGYNYSQSRLGLPESPRRRDIRAILEDPELRQQLIEGAVDFICKVEGIRD